MNKAKVSIVRADSYNITQVYSAIEKSLDLIGGLESIVKSNSKVFVKINHLSPHFKAEKGVITHPTFTQAVIKILKTVTADITVGDDIDSSAGDAYHISDYRQMCDELGVKLVNLRETGFTEINCRGIFLKKLHISSTVLDADIVINLPKLKTHSLTVMTGAIKNMYGIIPQGLRTKFHGEYIRTEDFCQMLVDVFSSNTPKLTIMDGIVAMEGEGPSAGSLRKTGLILSSTDAVAIDAVATKIIGCHPFDVYTTRYANERKLGIGNLENIEVAGEKLESLIISDFRLPSSAVNSLMKSIPKFISGFIRAQVVVKPQVNKKQCTRCRLCEQMCPVSAITIAGNEAAKIDKQVCIACMCCHEVCNSKAITPKRPILGRGIFVLHRILERFKSFSVWLVIM